MSYLVKAICVYFLENILEKPHISVGNWSYYNPNKLKEPKTPVLNVKKNKVAESKKNSRHGH